MVIAHDGTEPGTFERRMDIRPAHMAQGEKMMEDGSFLFGGAILDGAGKMSGGVLIVDFPDRDHLDQWLDNEPYITNHVWQRVEVHPFLVPPQFLTLLPKYAEGGGGQASGADAEDTQGAASDTGGAGAAGPQVPSPVVGTDWLADHLGQDGLAVVDCTVLHRPLPTGGIELESGRPGYAEGHVPGAVFADLLTDFADAGADRPFAVPPVERLVGALEDLGISDSDTVVLYDRAHMAFAARLWWLLRLLGHDRAAVLDGGWRKWTAEGRPSTAEVPAVARGRFEARRRPELAATREQVLAATEDPAACLINALSRDQHEGRVPVAHGRRGHIPSSTNVPAASLLDPETGALLPPDLLADRFEEVGALASGNVIVYCAAGVNAASDALALTTLGVHNVAIYDGGLSEWSGDPALPLVAEG
ncbi:rhodanese-like domain-containing protein [Nocardiopsis baichengensis]|uniref:rhodanese-like domain-containing protein n=1 Tax=Nocardiopsis baichengensis TaxID=280240 RepID=UPI001EF9E4A6|nr:rhodanese-like domain-containing protein [Nocardiopsis baichengensis]